MNSSIRSILALSLALVTSATVWAHDPAEHAKEAATKKAKADCSNMQKMDMSKMNMDDPVMQAMHSKCAKQMIQKNKDKDAKSAGHEEMNHANMDHSTMPMGDAKMHMPESSAAPASSAEHKHN
jgi:hypothetical protein